jgi:hypothetical protein
MAAAPVSSCGDIRGESPWGDFVRCVPNVAPPWELRAGVVGPFGAVKGPVGVGVIARVEAAMVCRVATRYMYLWSRVSMLSRLMSEICVICVATLLYLLTAFGVASVFRGSGSQPVLLRTDLLCRCGL